MDDPIVPIDDLAVTKLPNDDGPGVQLEWTYPSGEVINYFALRIDGREVDQRIELYQHRVHDTDTFRYTYWGLEPWTRHKVVMEAIATRGGRHRASHGNLRRYVTPRTTGIWLIDPELDTAVKIRGTDSPDLSFRESGTTYDIIGSEVPVRIIDSLGGYSGSVAGFVLGGHARSRFKELKHRSRKRALRLVYSDMNIPIRLEEASLSASSDIPTGQQKFDVGFSFFQDGEVKFNKGSH